MNAVSDFCNVPFFFFLVRKDNVIYDISVGFYLTNNSILRNKEVELYGFIK